MGLPLLIADGVSSTAALGIADELARGIYALDRVDFGPGDVVVDIGAHVGIVTCYLARRYPFLKIYAFEPFQDNYENLVYNVNKNGATNVVPFNLALTRDGRTLTMKVHAGNTGGATGQTRSLSDLGHTTFQVRSTTLDRVFEQNQITRCKLLKIDCEGSEHEILTTCSVLSKVEHLRGEFHINEQLRQKGYSIESLLSQCMKQVLPSNIEVETITMAE